jgi:hypothetical protein
MRIERTTDEEEEESRPDHRDGSYRLRPPRANGGAGE